MKDISQELHMEDDQLGFAATVSGGLGTDNTTSSVVVEPSSFVAAFARLLDHLNSCLQYCVSWRYPENRKKC